MSAKNPKNASVIYSTKLHDRTKGYLNNTLTKYNRWIFTSNNTYLFSDDNKLILTYLLLYKQCTRYFE